MPCNLCAPPTASPGADVGESSAPHLQEYFDWSTHPLPSPVLPQASLRVRIAKTPVHPDVRGIGARLADVRCRVAEASASDSEPSGSLSYSTSESGPVHSPGADVTVAEVRLASSDVASSVAAFCRLPAPLLGGEWR